MSFEWLATSCGEWSIERGGLPSTIRSRIHGPPKYNLKSRVPGSRRDCCQIRNLGPLHASDSGFNISGASVLSRRQHEQISSARCRKYLFGYPSRVELPVMCVFYNGYSTRADVCARSPVTDQTHVLISGFDAEHCRWSAVAGVSVPNPASGTSPKDAVIPSISAT